MLSIGIVDIFYDLFYTYYVFRYNNTNEYMINKCIHLWLLLTFDKSVLVYSPLYGSLYKVNWFY